MSQRQDITKLDHYPFFVKHDWLYIGGYLP